MMAAASPHVHIGHPAAPRACEDQPPPPWPLLPLGSSKWSSVISGRKHAQRIKQEVWQEGRMGGIGPHAAKGVVSVVLVGEKAASHSSILNKTRAAAGVGITAAL